MRPSLLLLAAATTASATDIPSYVGEIATRAFKIWQDQLPSIEDFTPQSAGLQSPNILPSLGGHATCVEGIIPVPASAQNTNLNYTGPSDVLGLTNTVIQFLQIQSPLAAMEMNQGPVAVQGTYNIASKICFPNTPVQNSGDLPLQFLIHGVGFDQSYWDFFDEEYSYIDYMAKKGYTTFSYDRLGVGGSAKPDPIEIVQSPLQVSIAHSLISMLRSGAIASTKFSKIVGVGHSFGSIQINAITKDYPADLDGAVLTGFSTNMMGLPAFLSGLNLDIASQNDPQRFPISLPNAYTVSSSPISNQIAFFRYPNFSPDVLTAAEATKGTFTLGELFTLGQVSGVADQFKGPVDIVNGENDLPFCQSNCQLPEDQGELAMKILYPENEGGDGGKTFLLEGAGHGLNLHFGAQDAYGQIAGFLGDNGL